jgi:ribosomal protein L40E
MAFSMHAAQLAGPRSVCDVCGASSSAERGTTCRRCHAGTLRDRGELLALRDQRRAARREAATAQQRRR